MKNSSSKLVQSLLRRSIYGSVAAAATIAAFGMVPSEALAGISNTKHNLTTDSGNTNKSSGTEICAFCHTPHASNTDMAAAPLWNKAVPDAGGYSVYVRTTLDSGSGTAGDPGAASLICLSCHDGSQAMDNMINAPGSSGWDSTGASAGYTWSGNGNIATDGKMPDGFVTNLGKDLRNDHPIGIEYCGGGSTPTAFVDCDDADFKSPTAVNATQWYVETSGADNGRQKEDIVLYPTGTTVRVECGSCHDPHVEPKGDSGTQTAFLRTSQVNSGLCLSCHVK
jgi:hypothetical protein